MCWQAHHTCQLQGLPDCYLVIGHTSTKFKCLLSPRNPNHPAASDSTCSGMRSRPVATMGFVLTPVAASLWSIKGPAPLKTGGNSASLFLRHRRRSG
jgi:hypothetical protein